MKNKGIKLIIVGGVAGGATAAARARRLDEYAEIVLFERGEYISFANCGLPYYIGAVIKDREDLLVTTAEAFQARYRVDVRTNVEVMSIDRRRKKVEVMDRAVGRVYEESYDRLILSPGAEPVVPPLPGIGLKNIFHLRTLNDSDAIKAKADSSEVQTALVVGGGFIGLEMAENLSHLGQGVTLVEKLDQVLTPFDSEMASIVESHLSDQGVRCLLGRSVNAFSEGASGVVAELDDGSRIEADLVILAIGIRSENRLAREAGLEIGDRGGIVVDATLRTSDPDIFAVGDAVQVRDRVTGLPVMTALAGPANKQGRMAADNALGRSSLFMGTIGTFVVKVFELTAAATGANERLLKASGRPYLASYTHSGSHAGYYPGAESLSIKILFAPADGQILGAQIVGRDGVDKRIDILATAIHGGMTVFDLEELELAYAPPYSSAKDPVNIAGFVAANILKGDHTVTHWTDMGLHGSDNVILIDLRNSEELESGALAGARHIPLNDLREHLDEFKPEDRHILYCAVGMRGYVGQRIMVQHGLKATNLSGGYITLAAALKK